MRVIVVGAGIGGLTLAGLLHGRGHDVELIEKAAAFGEVGAGIQISPNAGRVVAELGLADDLAEVAATPERIVLRRWADDRELLVRPLADAPTRRYGQPYINVYRPDLVDVLARRVEGSSICVATSVVDAGTTADGRSAFVDLGDGSRRHADVVVGADGINSVVRQALFGDHPTRFSGWVAYRALVPRERVPDLPIEVTNRLGPRAHLVSYFVGRDQRLLNLVGVVHEPSWDVESWTERGDLGQLRAYFANWSGALNAVLDHVVEPVFKWALHDRTPLEHWSCGRVALLGDACHPMVPFMAQGAAQALEDAAVLARCLELPGGIADAGAALVAYETTRRPRASSLQRSSFQNATTFHFPDGPQQRARDDVYAAMTGDGLDAMDRIYGYDALSTELVVS